MKKLWNAIKPWGPFAQALSAFVCVLLGITAAVQGDYAKGAYYMVSALVLEA